jgi:hypothetical protein
MEKIFVVPMGKKRKTCAIFFSSTPEKRKKTDLDVGVSFSNEKKEHSFMKFHDKMLVALTHTLVAFVPLIRGFWLSA